MSIKGSLESFYLSSLLQLLCNDRKTGILRLHDGDHEVTVVIRDGTIVNASSTVQEDQLGYLLRSEGVITSDALAASLQSSRLFNKKLGKVLIEQGLITVEKLQQYLRMQIEHILYMAFLWQKGDFEYEDAPVDPDVGGRIELDTMEIILEASRRVDEMSVLRRQVPAETEVAILSDRINVADMACLNPTEQAILNLIDNRRTIAQIIHESGYDTFTVYKCLYSLIAAGFVQAEQHQTTGDADSRRKPSLQLKAHAHPDQRGAATALAVMPTSEEQKSAATEQPQQRPAHRVFTKTRVALCIVLTCICIAAAATYALYHASKQRSAVPPQTPSQSPAARAPAAVRQPQPKSATTTALSSAQQPEPSPAAMPYQDPHQFFFVSLPPGYVVQDRSTAAATDVSFIYPPNMTMTVTAVRSTERWDTDTEMYNAIAGLQQAHSGLTKVQVLTYGPCDVGGARGYTLSGTALQESSFARLLVYGLHAYNKTVRIKIICKNCRNPHLESLLSSLREALLTTFLIYP